jgi:hypothetical protein
MLPQRFSSRCGPEREEDAGPLGHGTYRPESSFDHNRISTRPLSDAPIVRFLKLRRFMRGSIDETAPLKHIDEE